MSAARRIGWTVLVTGLALLAPAAEAQIVFEDITEAAQLTRIGPATGLSFFDFTGDGWDDLTFGATDAQVRLWENNRDGTFRDVTPFGGLRAGGLQSSPVWFDANDDAFPDLFVGGMRNGRSALFLNRGDGTFEDVTEAAGLVPDADVATVSAGDMDGDGRVDLFLAVMNGPDRLYRNLGDGTFADEASARGVVDPLDSIPMQAVWLDSDRDDDLDLLAVYDGLVRSRLFVNDGTGHFTEEAEARRIADVGPGNSMGIAPADLNGDGYADFYITRIGTAGLFLSGGSPGAAFAESAAAAGVTRNGMSWGAVFVDVDLDGDLDLPVVNTTGYDGTPALFYEQTGPLAFTERGTRVGFGFASESYGVAVGDLDRDGLPDLVVSSTQGRHRLLRNRSEPKGSPVAIRLAGPPGNRVAIGARVELHATDGTRTRWVTAGDGFISQQSATILFGLPSGSSAESVTVRWPDGSETHARPVPPVVAHAQVVARDTVPAPPSASQLSPHPVPAMTGTFQVLAPAARGLTLHDVQGRLLVRHSRSQPTTEWTVQTPSTPGLYLLRLTGAGGEPVDHTLVVVSR